MTQSILSNRNWQNDIDYSNVEVQRSPETQKEIDDLMLFKANQESLNSPCSTLRYFIDDYAIMNTDVGCYFMPLAKNRREFYCYDQYVHIKNLTHSDELPEDVREKILRLEEADAKINHLGLFVFCYDDAEDEYTVCYPENEIYFNICSQDFDFLNETSLEAIANLGMTKCVPPHNNMVYLESDGSVVA